MRSIGVIGASLAGLNAGVTLRREGYTGRLVVIGEEREAPYDRPPLSKEVVRAEWDPAQADLTYSAAAIDAEWKLGRRAVTFDAVQRTVRLDDGSSESFDGVVIATGAAPRRLPGFDLPGVHVLRTMADSLALRDDLARRPARVVVVGAGFIGQEVAASCRLLGLEVTMVEAAAPARHAVGNQIGLVLAEIHRSEGVDVRLGVAVAGMDGHNRVEQVHLSDGDHIAADVVVVGIGVTPNTDWLEGSGLIIDNGVVCDATCLAAPGVVAAGDVARWPNHRYGEARRVEHWDNAIRQAEHAARRLLAADGSAAATRPYEPVPWFWSDQYGLKLQLVGSAFAHDEVLIAHGSAQSRKFVALYRRGDRLTGAFGLSSAGRILKYRQLLEKNPSWDDAVIKI